LGGVSWEANILSSLFTGGLEGGGDVVLIMVQRDRKNKKKKKKPQQKEKKRRKKNLQNQGKRNHVMVMDSYTLGDGDILDSEERGDGKAR